MNSGTSDNVDILPLSCGQEALWLMHQCAPDSGMYNIEFAWEIPDTVDLPILKKSLQILIDRHPALRSVYPEQDGTPVQRVLSHYELVFEEFDVAGIDEPQLFRDYLDKELKRPFDLSTQAPMRWYLLLREERPRVLVMVLQHINVDLWALMIFINELRDVYGALKQAKPLNLPAIDKNFSEFVQWQNDFIASEQGQQEKAFWLSELEGMNSNLNLPTDRPRPPVMSCRGGYHRIALSESPVFNELASRYGISLFSLYLALYQLLLYKYTGQDDIAVGTPTAGRDDTFAGIYGYFVNTVIVRSQIDAGVSLQEFFQAVDKKAKAAITHQNYPLADLAKHLSVTRSTSEASLIQTTFAWENINRFENRDVPLVDVDAQGERWWDMGELGQWHHFARRRQLDNFDLIFKVYKFQNQFYCGLEYNGDLFDAATIERMADHYQGLMAQVAANPQRSLAEVTLLTPPERQALLTDWNQTQVPYADTPLFVQMFEQVAAAQPDATALAFQGQSLSYREVNQRANQMAHYLLAQGLVSTSSEAETVVGISLPRSMDMIVAMLAIWKAGAAYLPLDPDYPSERLAYMQEDSQAALVITSAAVEQRCNWSQVTTLCVDRDAAKLALCAVHNPALLRQPEALAYVIYTSGSTGRPKGVMVEQGALKHLTVTQQPVFDVNVDDKVMLFASLNFDTSLFAIVLALQNGAALHMCQKEVSFGEALEQLLHQEQISWVLLPPPVAATMRPERLPMLRTVVVAGEACPAELAGQWAHNRRLINLYGPTEYSVWSTYAELTGDGGAPIGRPVANSRVYILDGQLNPLPVGVPGELHVSGPGMARGYLNRDDLTAQKFIANPFADAADPRYARLYKTGDLVRYGADGNIEFLGRIDHQVKIRGFRIEPGEIEAQLSHHEDVQGALVMARNDVGAAGAGQQLVAYVVLKPQATVTMADLKRELQAHLPDYMVPVAFVPMDRFPLTPSDKIDRNALPAPQSAALVATAVDQAPLPLSANVIEAQLQEVWQRVLGLASVPLDANFFDLGGHSLLLAQVYRDMPDEARTQLTMVDLFKYPTIADLAHYLQQQTSSQTSTKQPWRQRHQRATPEESIAVIGMAGRFPGADSIESLWHNILAGRESIAFHSEGELRASGVSDVLLADQHYVAAQGCLTDVQGFDADFFGITPREAQVMDPQQRLFLECAWQALEDAGLEAQSFTGSVGVYGGVGRNDYAERHLPFHPESTQLVGDYALSIANDKDFLCSRVAYKLALEGPAVVVQTACSTSLVAVHMACQALLLGECDAALAGGVSLGRLDKMGYLYQPGMILSPDGHCRAFDAGASGTVPGQGAGIVVLKRLSEALAQGDHIYASIQGSAINNDGAQKPGYTSPAVTGQAKVVQMALANAGLEGADIGYLETHGTGTPVGDPIEIEGLTEAFALDSEQPRQGCAIGSLKPNVGHLDAASGVAGLIKAVKALQAQVLPPSLHYQQANPAIDFAQSPFYVNTEARPWPLTERGRFAGVSSFGIGGTNAHVVLAEAPSAAKSSADKDERFPEPVLLSLSAATPEALVEATRNLARHLEQQPQLALADVAYTLQQGRKAMAFRRQWLCQDRQQAVETLKADAAGALMVPACDQQRTQMAWLFSGQGSQFVGMGHDLYQHLPVFRQYIDQCWTQLQTITERSQAGLALPDFLSLSREQIQQTYITQPLLFSVEYALAKSLMDLGLEPEVMIGHSLGEYVAACLAGVFSLPQALQLVARRGQLMQGLPSGQMLAVDLTEQQARAYLHDGLDLAAVNSAQRCVIAGAVTHISGLQERLQRDGVRQRLLPTSHAFHSQMMQPILAEFGELVADLAPQAPQRAMISSVTGLPLTAAQAQDPGYWMAQLRREVRFADGLESVFAQRRSDADWLLLELGPGATLTTLARQHDRRQRGDLILESLSNANTPAGEWGRFLQVLGRLWCRGVPLHWPSLGMASSCKVSLPTYPFQRRRHWLASGTAQAPEAIALDRLADSDPKRGNREGDCVSTAHPDAPRDLVEQAVADLWQAQLGVESPGYDDDFFELGGDSLQAVGMLEQLRQQFQVALPSQCLMQHPTVAALALYIKTKHQTTESEGVPGADDTAETSALVCVQEGESDKKPLFMVHPIGGEIYFYRDIARQLGVDQPFYAFKAPSLSGDVAPYDSIVEMAQTYIEQMRQMGAQPPYLIGGSSFGGLVAFEMAQQFKRMGEEVELVIMIDTPVPDELPTHLTDSAAILHFLFNDKMPISVETLRSMPEAEQVPYLLQQQRQMGGREFLPPHLGVPLFKTWIAHQQATYDYRPKSYDGDVMYFRHSEPMSDFPAEPHVAWQTFLSEPMQVHQVPGNHISMNFPPHIDDLSKHLRRYLDTRLIPVGVGQADLVGFVSP